MITKEKLVKLKKVYVTVYTNTDKFENGQKSKSIIVYDASPDEVFAKVTNTLNE